MDRCALFVDAGYVLTDGAMAVHGTRRRESVTWDYAGLLQLLSGVAAERTGQSLLRCYWYEATVEGRRSAEHDTLADLPGVKVRVTKMRPGRREGVEGEIHRDLTTLARNKAVSDVMVVSAEEDLAQVVADVQDMGMRVTLLHIAEGGSRPISRTLRQECDDVVEVSAEQLRPYVDLVSGAEPPRPDEAEAGTGTGTAAQAGAGIGGGAGQFGPRLAVNANGNGNGNGLNGGSLNGGSLNGGGHGPAGRPAGYGQPQGRPAAVPQPPVSPAQDQAPRPASRPAALENPQSDPGQAERADRQERADRPDFPAPADYLPAADYGAGLDYGAPGEYGAPADYAPAPEHAPAAEPPGAIDYRPVADYPAPGSVQPREDIYGAPVALPAPGEDIAADRGRGRPDPAGYAYGGVREPYQRDARDLVGGEHGDRLQPVPVTPPGGPSAQVRRLPARGALPSGPVQPLPPLGLPPAPADAGPQYGAGQPAQQPVGPPTGSQPVAPVAPVVPMDPGGLGYGAGRGAAPGAPRHVAAGPNPNSGPQPAAGPSGQGIPAAPQAQQPQQVPQGPPMTGGQQGHGGPEMGGQPAPLGLVGPGGYPGGAAGVSLSDAVQSAHEEGQAFGESVARDAPALWLEAVLARKPRMPSDLEARLLQGSALPIDFLLHDEVRHALRRGFWDALERARR